jgi:hypothetical protein
LENSFNSQTLEPIDSLLPLVTGLLGLGLNVEFGVQIDGTPLPNGTPHLNPKVTPKQPQSNPKVVEPSGPDFARISPRKDVKEEREKDVDVDVEINQPNPKVVDALTPREEDLVEELVTRFRDEKSRATYRRIVSKLGDAIAYRLMVAAWEVRDRIAVSPGAYFVGMARQVAREQGIELGLKPT